ncbi:SBBP repeat-containing protein [Myxococcaceae bacterium GXIMD 01537]
MNRKMRLWSLCGLTGVAATLGAPVSALAQGTSYMWAQQVASAGDDQAFAIAAHGGDVFTVGFSTGQFAVEPAAGGSDLFVTKHDSTGAQVWSHQLGTSEFERAQGVAVAADGSVYVTGSTLGDLDGNTNAGGHDAFLVKYDASGIKQWTRLLGSSTDDFSLGVSVGPDGSPSIAGYTLGAHGGATNAGGHDVLVAKYDASGTLQWTRQLGSTKADQAQGISVAPDGSVYVAGTTSGPLDGNAHAGSMDLFLLKYDSAGTKQWSRQRGNLNSNYGQAVAAGADGSVYVTGYTWGALDGETNTGLYDAFLVRYDSAGTHHWTRLFGTSQPEYATDVAVDANGNAYVTGYTDGLLPGQTGAGSTDTFLVKYDSTGDKWFNRQVGTSESDFARGVALDDNGNPYVAGYTWGAFPGAPNAGGYDAFIIRHLP